jgi:hypothetical protein
MNHKRFYIFMTLIISIFNFHCTVIGVTAGILKDSKKPDILLINEHTKIKQGTEVLVQTYKGDTIRGKFQGLIPRSIVTYKESFEKCQRILPDILVDSANVFLSLDNGKIFQGKLLGFAPDIIRFNWNHSDRYYLLEIPINRLNSMWCDNTNQISKDSIKYWMHQDIIPSDSTIVLSKNSTWVTLPYMSIKSIQKLERTNYVLNGGLIGLSIDAIITTIIYSSGGFQLFKF